MSKADAATKVYTRQNEYHQCTRGHAPSAVFWRLAALTSVGLRPVRLYPLPCQTPKYDAEPCVPLNTDGIFADAFNFCLYDGKPVICPEQLHELDTAKLALPYGTDGAASPVQRFRDSLKELSAMEEGRAACLLLGIEGQTSVHYAAPVPGTYPKAQGPFAKQLK